MFHRMGAKWALTLHKHVYIVYIYIYMYLFILINSIQYMYGREFYLSPIGNAPARTHS